MSDFNSWFKKKFRDLHDAILCGDLVAGNYKKVSKKSYEAGQQSRQKQIDELKKELETLQGMCNAVSLVAGDLVEERDELQNRIEVVLDRVVNHGGYDDLTHIINILKGEM